MKKMFTPHEKAKIALEAAKEVKTPNQIAGEYEAHPIQIGLWKRRLKEKAHLLFAGKENGREDKDRQELIDRLYRTIGERDVELAWLKKKLHLVP